MADDPPLPTLTSPVEDTSVTSIEVAPTTQMGDINSLYTMGKIAKGRTDAEADVAEDVTKVNPL